MFLALAGILAWGGTVDPRKSIARWIAVVALVAWAVWTLRHERTRIEQVYAQILAMGLSVAAVGWLVPASGSLGLMMIGGILALVSSGLLLRSWIRRCNAADDESNRQG